MYSRRVRASVLPMLCLVATLTGCASDDEDAGDSPDAGCGLVDAGIAADVLGTGRLSSSGTGVVPPSSRSEQSMTCDVSSKLDTSAFLRVSVRTPTESDLAADRANWQSADPTINPGCEQPQQIEGSRAVGVSCVEDVSGGQATRLYSVWDDRVVVVTVGLGKQAAPTDTKLALTAAENVDKNIADHDKKDAS